MEQQLPKLFTVREVADWLDMSEDTVRRLARTRQLESLKPAGQYRFTEAAIWRYIEGSRV